MFSFFKNNKDFEVLAPVSGKVVNLEDVNDPVFSTKMMGDGVAIQLSGNVVLSPASGTISTVIMPSCHAFGINCDNGLEIIVHVGIETVNLKGEGFTLLKNKGDHVEKGEPIIRIDKEMLEEKGFDLITPIVVTNSDTFSVSYRAEGDVVAGKSVAFKVKHMVK